MQRPAPAASEVHGVEPGRPQIAAEPPPAAERPRIASEPPFVADAHPEPAAPPAAIEIEDRPAALPLAATADARDDVASVTAHALTNGNGHAPIGTAGCTPAQMRRFIKSRPWIPMHELRRRFGINGHEDDVTPMAVGPRTLFVGLPEREGRMLGELLRGGDVGYELSVDPDTPVVIGVFPMRPVART